jgi:hypothetical protein
MILELPRILRQVVPGLVGEHELSVVRIRTTRPVYLVFLEDPACARADIGEGADPFEPQAVCAVQVGPRTEITRLHEAMATLHRALPDNIPAAAPFARLSDNTFVLVQEVMAGVPWFRIRDQLRGLEAWLQFRERALDALQMLHDAIRQRPEWRVRVDVGRALFRQAREAARYKMVSREVCAELQHRGSSLLARPVQWFFQHGDFCVNNLIVGPDRLGIIDFEEFGHTVVPLHDEFSLALSCQDFMEGLPGAPTLGEQVRACIAPALARVPALEPLVPTLFLHHLAWRINQCHDRPTRADMRDRLVRLLMQAVGPEMAGRPPRTLAVPSGSVQAPAIRPEPAQAAALQSAPSVRTPMTPTARTSDPADRTRVPSAAVSGDEYRRPMRFAKWTRTGPR